MAALPLRQDGKEVLFLRPDQIVTDDRFNVRAYGDGENEEVIQQLATSIERDGQLDSGIVIAVENTKPEDDGSKGEHYILIAGHRRRRAIALLNERYSLSGKPLLQMRVVVDRSGGDHTRKAIVSNLHRKDFSPMDLATLINRIKTENGWLEQGFAATKKLAAYLSVSVPTIIQHEKFLTIDGDLQKRLHGGQISAQSALDLLSVSPEKRDEVLGRAAAIQAEKDAADQKAKAEKEAKAWKAPKIPVPPTSNADQSDASLDSKQSMKPEKKRIERPAVVKAIREVDKETVIPRTRKEIVEFFAQLDGPAYGYIDSSVRQFITYFQKWQAGNGTERTLLAKFDAMTEKADKGTKAAQEKADKAEASKAEKEAQDKAASKEKAKAEKKAAKPKKEPTPKKEAKVSKPKADKPATTAKKAKAKETAVAATPTE